jgi:arylformamidase
MIDLNKYKLIDLTHEMYDEMPGWPTHPIFKIEQLKIMDTDGYNVKQLIMNTHHGTHMDAPSHMLKEGKTCSEYSIQKFMGNGRVVDLSYKKPREAIEKDDLSNFSIKRGEIVLLYTGWGSKRGWNEEYLYSWPYLDTSGAEYLAEIGISAVGTDGLSIGAWAGSTVVAGPVSKTAIKVHQILLKRDILIFEELANLDYVLNGDKEREAYFIILPLSLRGADGSPVRAIAIVSD